MKKNTTFGSAAFPRWKAEKWTKIFVIPHKSICYGRESEWVSNVSGTDFLQWHMNMPLEELVSLSK